MSDSPPLRLHAIIFGKVQGVFFRDTTLRTASELKLVGWVRNLPNESVEVIAEGSHDSLESLLNFLRVGPPQAHVEQVAADWQLATSEFSSFTVR
ncbi:MAG: acylphosphatase [Chloroflexi bacterium]|nr:acylphosphatase [Chloroflexota bacterium]